MMVVDSKLMVEKGKEIKDLNGWSPTLVDTDRSLDLSIHISLADRVADRRKARRQMTHRLGVLV
jgi:hypothetical protein